MKTQTILFLFLISINLSAQNLITNNGFEISSDCPTNIGQFHFLDTWEEIIVSTDFYNCGITDVTFPTVSAANSGTGYAGFGLYGNLSVAAEAIGQILSTPLEPNITYQLKVAAKKPNGGPNFSTCAGIAIYGFRDTIQDVTTNMHLSEYDSVQFLGVTDIVGNEDWSDFEIEITPLDTINYIAFTLEQVPFCRQYIFIDDIVLRLDLSSNINESDVTPFDVYPNPFQSTLRLDYQKKETIISIEIFNELGQSVFMSNGFEEELNISHLSKGIYFLKATDELGNIFTKKIIKADVD